MTWEDLEKVNSEITPTDINTKQGTKPYVEVKERVKAFRKLYPNGRIETSYEILDKTLLFTAYIYDEKNNLLANGHATQSLTRFFGWEDCETSAIGRAIGFLGIGISTAISTAEEMKAVEEKQVFDIPIKKTKEQLVKEFETLYPLEEQIRLLNGLQVKSASDLDEETLELYVKFINGKKQTNESKRNNKKN